MFSASMARTSCRTVVVMVGTSDALMERTILWKSASRHMRRNSMALSTIPSVPSPKRLITLSEREPWFTPMRIAVPLARHSSRNGSSRWRRRCSSAAYSLSVNTILRNVRPGSAKFPGFILTFSTCFAASKAAAGLKCMSATSGVSIPWLRKRLCISSRAAACCIPWAVRRMSSAPAPASLAAWATLASMSRVGVVVMLCTRTGASPPITVFPTATGTVCRRTDPALLMVNPL